MARLLLQLGPYLSPRDLRSHFFFFFQAEDGIRDVAVTGVQTCALPISQEFSLGDIERDVVQHGNRHAVPTIGLRHTANLDNRIGHTLLYCTVTLAPPRDRKSVV